jgi:hypothetical protein
MKRALAFALALVALTGCKLSIVYDEADVWSLWRKPIVAGDAHLATFDSQMFKLDPNHNRKACEQVAALFNSGPIIASFIEDSPGNMFLYLSHLEAIEALNYGHEWQLQFYCRPGRP